MQNIYLQYRQYLKFNILKKHLHIILIPAGFSLAGSLSGKRCSRHFGVSMKYGAFELLYLRQVQKRPFRL